MAREPDLTIREAAELLKVHPETIRVWARRGEFPHAYLLPGRSGYRIPSADLEDLRRRYRSSEPPEDEDEEGSHMTRDELNRRVGGELEHIPRKPWPQGLIRADYNARRRHELSENPATPRAATFARTLASVRATVPDFDPQYDRAFFEEPDEA